MTYSSFSFTLCAYSHTKRNVEVVVDCSLLLFDFEDLTFLFVNALVLTTCRSLSSASTLTSAPTMKVTTGHGPADKNFKNEMVLIV